MELIRQVIIDKLIRLGVKEVAGKPLKDVPTTELYALLRRLEMQRQSSRSV